MGDMKKEEGDESARKPDSKLLVVKGKKSWSACASRRGLAVSKGPRVLVFEPYSGLFFSCLSTRGAFD